MQISNFINKYQFFIRILVGLLFIASAVSKLISIDNFEVYIYSFGWMPFDVSVVAARILISLELALGLLFVAGKLLRIASLVSVFLLSVFTIFIIYLLFSNNKESCHCFGDVLVLSHTTSIVKNIVAIALSFLFINAKDSIFRFSRWYILFVLVFSLVLPFAVSSPDFLNYESYNSRISYNNKLVDKYISEHAELKEGRRVVAFFSTGCRFCKLASKKLSVIASKSNAEKRFSYIFWGTDESVKRFYTETASTIFEYEIMNPVDFLNTTKGDMPLILILNNGKVEHYYGYRSLNEREIVDLLSKE